jgi:hypothetical protein
MSSSDTEESESAKLSALKENLQRKGKNAYYYAHSHGANGPEWDGKEEPRLLSVSQTTVSTEQVRKKVATPIDSYGWSDGKKTVKILVDFENALDIPDEDISLVSMWLSEWNHLLAELCWYGVKFLYNYFMFPNRFMLVNKVTTENSVDFRITRDGKDHGLTISPLNECIESASFKKKDTRVDIILKKKDAITWHELRRKS